MSLIKSAGFSGDNWFIAAHSLGGVMTQQWLAGKDKNAALMKGQILMSSVLTRDRKEIMNDGHTNIKFNTPTMTIGGTKDGLMRITRVAEAYWH